FSESGADITSQVTFAWASTNPSLASIDSRGVVTAQVVGHVSIVAVAGGAAGVAALTVFAPPTLTLAGAGTGSGRVVSTPAGIDCLVAKGVAGATGCSANFDPGVRVTLNLTLWTGVTLTSWSEAGCAG